jgi:hypothetical protein
MPEQAQAQRRETDKAAHKDLVAAPGSRAAQCPGDRGFAADDDIDGRSTGDDGCVTPDERNAKPPRQVEQPPVKLLDPAARRPPGER